MKQIQRRIPRPIGTTEIALTYHKDKTEDNRQQLQKHIINHYINNNFSYCNRFYNIEEISMYMGIEQSKVLYYTIKYGNEVRSTMDSMSGQDTLKALFALTIKGSLEDRSRAVEQLSILQASQGAIYRPFISGEVNKALKLVMESNSNMASLVLGLIKGSGTTNILNVMGDQATGGTQGIQDKDILTLDNAIMQIKEMGIPALGQNEEARELIYDSNQIDQMPEVNARLQIGVDTSKEGLNINKLTRLQAIEPNLEDVEDAVIIKKKSTHINRRQKELDIDPNDDRL